MHRSAITVGFLIAGGLIAPAVNSPISLAAEKHQEYKSPGSIKKLLLKEPLHGVKGEQVTVIRVTFPPGWVGGKHYHTGPVYVYGLKGTFVVHEKGKAPQTITPGTLYREPIGNPMQARNASASEASEVLVIQIDHKGAPLMIKTNY